MRPGRLAEMPIPTHACCCPPDSLQEAPRLLFLLSPWLSRISLIISWQESGNQGWHAD